MFGFKFLDRRHLVYKWNRFDIISISRACRDSSVVVAPRC